MEDIWRDIKGYEGLYQVSNTGKVKSLGHGKCSLWKEPRVMKGQKIRSGYLLVHLWKCGEKKYALIHRLVAEAFIVNPENKETVNHIDGNKTNNCVDNLEWNTYSENITHAFNNGLNYAVGKKQIIQKDKKGNIIKVWDSIKEAAKNMNVCTSSLRACCRNNTYTIRGYKWELLNNSII